MRSGTRRGGPESLRDPHPRDTQEDEQPNPASALALLWARVGPQALYSSTSITLRSYALFSHRLSFRSSVHTPKISKTRKKNLAEGRVKLSFLSGVHFHYTMQQHGKGFFGVKSCSTFSKRCKKYLHHYAPQKWNRKTLAIMVLVSCRILNTRKRYFNRLVACSLSETWQLPTWEFWMFGWFKPHA